MTPKQANRRYVRLMLGGSFGYAVSLLGITFLLGKSDTITFGSVAFGLIPGIFVLIMLYSIWRFLKETDEAARHFASQDMMFATFIILAISGTWGLLEMLLDSLPKLPVFWLFPAFFMAFGAMSLLGPNRNQRAHCA